MKKRDPKKQAKLEKRTAKRAEYEKARRRKFLLSKAQSAEKTE